MKRLSIPHPSLRRNRGGALTRGAPGPGAPAASRDYAGEEGRRLSGRLGLNLPYEWWPRPAALKAMEAAGFAWVQVASPPVEMLAHPHHVARHAEAVRRSLEVTSLLTIAHGPTNLRLGSSHDRAFEGLLEYAQALGASQVVYHALDLPERGEDSEREERALRSFARVAESLGLVICLENLSPVYPGSHALSHDPETVRDLVLHCDSPAVRMLLDVGHANIVADGAAADLAALVEPVLDVVSLFHVHDNLGARSQDSGDFAFDPLRLDLHLPPGAGSLPWDRIAAALVEHSAPLMLEVHPSQRPNAAAVCELAKAALLGRPPWRRPLELLPRSLA
jgi:sugar phosphate isomerase/epimerase